MKNYCCPKCGSIDLFIDARENQKALMCSDCGAWIKWVSKKELPLVNKFIENNKIEPVRGQRSKQNNFRVESLLDTLIIHKNLLKVENNAFNRGVVKGLEIAMNILNIEDK